MSLAPESSSHGRSRSKSPGRRDRDRSPARAPSPSPNLYSDRKYNYEYAQPKFEYAEPKLDHHEPKYDYPSSLHGQESNQGPPISPSYHSYAQPAQYPPAAHAGHPNYVQPNPYEHAHVSASYAGPQTYHQQGRAQGPPPQSPDFTRSDEHSHGSSEDHPSYANPAPYEYAHTDDRAERPPSPPRTEHAKYASFSSSDNANMRPGESHTPRPGFGGYARPNEYSHASSDDHPSYANPDPYPYAQTDDRGWRPPPSPKPEHMGHHSFGSSANVNMKTGEGHEPGYARLNEYSHGTSEDHPSYANPESFHYAQPEDRSGRPPPSPRPEHPGYMSFADVDQKTGGNHSQPQMPQYATSPVYNYAQPAPQPPTSHPDPARTYHSGGYATKTGQSAGSGPDYAKPGGYQYAQPPQDIKYSKQSVEYATPEGGIKYSKPSVEYAQPKQDIKYKYKSSQPSVEHVQEGSLAEYGQQGKPDEMHRSHQTSAQHVQERRRQDKEEKAKVVEISPGGGKLQAPPSPGLGPRMHRLSVSGGPGPSVLGPAGAPPGSPLLEAYRGTYQSISPMPSPIMLPSSLDDDDLSDITPLSAGMGSSDEEARPRGREKSKGKEKEKRKKQVKFYDPEKDTKELVQALRHRDIELNPLIDILPRLTHEHMMQIRTEYKKYAKVQGKGINIAKHIKMKLGTGPFGKVCYVTALGRWESEAYWANFWYQTNTTRRELLIESLMGRTNAEIREIKAAFSDKRYNDSLEKCMKAELKADKFRTAVLLALEEKRQEESKYVYAEAVRDDVRRLHDALVAREGGETAMIHIVVTRSDTHMREVLKSYEKSYGKNFAKEMLRKSTNLVGETLAHILNGIINKPVRDALLLHQALNEESSNKERTDLLISRLVRYHWDPVHFERIRTEYRARYGKELLTAVKEGTKGDFGDFCMQLCLRRS